MSASPQNVMAHPEIAEGSRLGRFVLQRVLGQGAQATVWLALDPRLERQVAIKLVRCAPGVDARSLHQWLREARSVGRIAHPNIVALFEADVQDQQPYLVFEYVPGQTLAEHLRERGALPARAAVQIMLGVLGALQAAHAAGVVHLDLKPSNILIDPSGEARVTDFGIAARLAQPEAGATGSGTPGYMAPEAAAGAPASTAMDVFSAGLLLAQLLTGQRLLKESDPTRATQRMATEDLALPEKSAAKAGDPVIDDHLRSIVQQAIRRVPEQRLSSIAVMHQALQSWLENDNASRQVEAPPAAGHNKAALDFLLRRMRRKSDFPALSDSVARIQKLANSDNESVSSLTNEILKDVALTNKLLRLVNTANFTHAGGGGISTVSRAVALVGFNGIRNMALSLVLLEHMQDKAQAEQLKEEFLRSLMAGSIGAELCPVLRESEEAFIGSMFQNLGRLLVQFYFAEEAHQIRSLVRSKREPVPEAAAAVTVLGLSFEELGVGIAKAWGLPQTIQRCMRKPSGTPPGKAPAEFSERMRWISMAANEIADVLLHSDPKEVDSHIAGITRKYAQVVGSSASDMQAATVKARQKLTDLAVAMEIRVAPGSAAAKLLKQPPGSGSDAQLAKRENDANLGSFELQATQAVHVDAGQNAPVKDDRVAQTLSAGIQDITNAMVEDFKLSDVLRMILETMYRAMGFGHIIFCMRDPKTETMTGRFGLGEGVEQHVKSFRVPLRAATPDLFAVVCNKGADTMISDTTEPKILQRLPDWYLKGINAPAFLLLPLQIKGAPFGLIYADKKAHGTLELDDKELALLRTLRNQAVMAFKQSS